MKSLTLDLMRKVFDRVLDKLTGRGSRTVPRVDELSPVVWSGYLGIDGIMKSNHGRLCMGNLILAITATFCYVIYRHFSDMELETTFMGSGSVGLGRRGPKVSPLSCFTVLESVLAIGLLYVWIRDSGLRVHQVFSDVFGLFGLIQILNGALKFAAFASADTEPLHPNLFDFAFGTYVWLSHVMYGMLAKFDA